MTPPTGLGPATRSIHVHTHPCAVEWNTALARGRRRPLRSVGIVCKKIGKRGRAASRRGGHHYAHHAGPSECAHPRPMPPLRTSTQAESRLTSSGSFHSGRLGGYGEAGFNLLGGLGHRDPAIRPPSTLRPTGDAGTAQQDSLGRRPGAPGGSALATTSVDWTAGGREHPIFLHRGQHSFAEKSEKWGNSKSTHDIVSI